MAVGHKVTLTATVCFRFLYAFPVDIVNVYC